MRSIKYIISFCVMFIGILVIGESHTFYLDNFYNQYDNTTLYLQDNTTSKEMITDIINSAINNKVEVFTFKRSQSAVKSIEYDIYGTIGAENYINKASNIFEGKYRSLFLGDINFKFNDIRSISEINNLHDYYVIGNREQVKQFKMDLIDKYAGNHPKQGFPDKESRNNTIAIWFLIISVILLLSFYDVISQKKESIIKISFGERISKLILKNIFLDFLVFILFFILILIMLLKYTYVCFNLKISLISFFILIFINSLLYLNLYFFNIKESFSNNQGYKNLLSLNYSFKIITTILTIFIISSNIAFIIQSYSLYKQKSFFEDYSDYYYIKLSYKPVENINAFEESAKVQGAFYEEFCEEFNAMSVKDITNFSEMQSIFANKNAFKYLSSKIHEINNIDLNKDFYFIIPESMKDNDDVIEDLKLYVESYEGDNFSYNYDVIYYNDNINIVGINEDTLYGSELLKNPSIIYNNMIENQMKAEDDDLFSNRSDYLYDTMYKLSSKNDSDKVNKFIEEHNLKDQIVNKVNILDKYKDSWIIAKRILYINLIFSTLVLLLELIIINSIIRLEYKINAIELSIKKVIGYSILEKNKKIIIMVVITTILSTLISVIVSLIMKFEYAYYLAFGGVIILILELFVIMFYINKVETSEILKILKGGNL